MSDPSDRPGRAVVGDRRPPRRGDHQRAVLIDSVTELLATVPIADLSVMQIAKHAGVTRPVFYFYFETKYAVVAAALERVWGEFERARAIRPEAASAAPAETTRRLIADAVAVWQEHAALLQACVQARVSDPQLGRLWDDFVGATATELSDLFEILRTEGRITPVSADVPALVEALLGMTIWLLLEDRTPGRPGTERRVDAIAAVWLAAIWGSRPDAPTV